MGTRRSLAGGGEQGEPRDGSRKVEPRPKRSRPSLASLPLTTRAPRIASVDMKQTGSAELFVPRLARYLSSPWQPC